jgi:hypothetical protein
MSFKPSPDVEREPGSIQLVDRVNSVRLVESPTIRPSARIPGEFRTLRYGFLFLKFSFPCHVELGSDGKCSIHVADTKEGRYESKKKDVKGLEAKSNNVSAALTETAPQTFRILNGTHSPLTKFACVSVYLQSLV